MIKAHVYKQARLFFAGQSLTPVEVSNHFNIQEALVKNLLLQLPGFEADYPPVIHLRDLL